ncbi:MAG: phosphatidate cytidylyltransferase, partial [Clostridia bacterium]|nr:phosphatidate cytidylyltransferase [Clostridia bacterium]
YGLIVGLFGSVTPQYLSLVVAGMLMSVASMIGDLVASLVKRNYGVKDYSRLLPGHGGVLDRFDSTLAAAFILIILYELPFGFGLFK